METEDDGILYGEDKLEKHGNKKMKRVNIDVENSHFEMRTSLTLDGEIEESDSEVIDMRDRENLTQPIPIEEVIGSEKGKEIKNAPFKNKIK